MSACVRQASTVVAWRWVMPRQKPVPVTSIVFVGSHWRHGALALVPSENRLGRFLARNCIFRMPRIKSVAVCISLQFPENTLAKRIRRRHPFKVVNAPKSWMDFTNWWTNSDVGTSSSATTMALSLHSFLPPSLLYTVLRPPLILSKITTTTHRCVLLYQLSLAHRWTWSVRRRYVSLSYLVCIALLNCASAKWGMIVQ